MYRIQNFFSDFYDTHSIDTFILPSCESNILNLSFEMEWDVVWQITYTILQNKRRVGRNAGLLVFRYSQEISRITEHNAFISVSVSETKSGCQERWLILWCRHDKVNIVKKHFVEELLPNAFEVWYVVISCDYLKCWYHFTQRILLSGNCLKDWQLLSSISSSSK